jgi:hypothetical protein
VGCQEKKVLDEADVYHKTKVKKKSTARKPINRNRGTIRGGIRLKFVKLSN